MGPVLCNPLDCSLPASSVHEIFQAIVLEWIAISFSGGSSQPRDRTQVSRIAGRFFTLYEPQIRSVTRSCPTLCNPMDCSLPGSSFPWNFPGKNTAVGCHFLLQVIFQTQGSNPSLLHLLPWQAESVPLCHWGSLVAVQAADCRWLRPPPSTAPVCHPLPRMPTTPLHEAR